MNVEEAKNVPLVERLMVFSWRVVLGLIDKATKPRFFIFIHWLCSEYVELLWESICAVIMGIYGHFVKDMVWL